MKMQFIAHKEPALKIHSDVQIIAVFLRRGIAMAMMTVEMERTSRQNTANLKDERALEISSRATMAIAFREFIFAMATTIVSITAMKIIDINATIVNVTPKLNSHVKKISNGDGLNAYRRNGFVMEVKIEK